MKDRTNKSTYSGPLRMNELIERRASGELERVVIQPDLGPAHAPHVDLFLKPAGGEQEKARVYDANAARGGRIEF